MTPDTSQTGMQPPDPAPPTDLVRLIFFNERELRPGWRIAIASSLFLVIALFLAAVVRLAHLPQGLTPPNLILQETLTFSTIVLVSWIMSRIEHRNMAEYGLPLRRAQALFRFVRGYVLWGFLPLSLLLLTLRALHSFYFGSLVLHGGQIWLWAGVWGFFFLLVGLTEEYTFRGYLLYTLADWIGFWPAAVVLAALFGTLHAQNGGENPIGVIMTTFFAIFATIVLRYTGNLWLVVGAHAGWDWSQSYLYGVSDSGLQIPGHLLNPHIQGPAWLNGGSVGPEGSVLCLVLLVVMSVLFVLLYHKPKAPELALGKG